ncbi:hypothetical protein [Paucibacter soli]|uniref:hypothetical protein n=1 Tax=Paucibacter soli TaxID=3133433 RepID=UPI0030AD784B
MRPHDTWPNDVSLAVAEHRHEDLLELFAGPDARSRMLLGFVVPPDLDGGYCFAQLCLHHRNIDALRLIVERAPAGISYQDTITYDCHHGTSSLFKTVTNLPMEALNCRSAAALQLAAEHEPKSPHFKTPIKAHGNKTLHLAGLDWLFQKRTTAADAADLADACRVLMKMGAPAHSKDDGSLSLVTILFSRAWHSYPAADQLTQLVRDYVAAGAIQLAGRGPANQDQSPHAAYGNTPLEYAIKAGNGLAAAVAIELGADMKAATPAGHECLISFAKDFAVLDDTQTLVPRITEAVMRRQIRAVEAQEATLSSASLPPTSPPPRVGRLGL